MKISEVRAHPSIALAFVLALVAALLLGGNVPVQDARAQSGAGGTVSRVFVEISVNGTPVDTEFGYDTTISDLAGDDLSTLNEAFDFTAQFRRASRGALMVDPIAFSIRAGKSAPLLMRAATDGSRVDVEVRFYGPDPDTGGTLRYQTYTIRQGAITGYELISPSTLDPDTASHPFLVRLEMTGSAHELESEFGTTATYDGGRR